MHHPQAPHRGAETLLLIGPERTDRPDRPHRLVTRRQRWWTRVAATALASSLDRQLARGRAPESSVLLAARARVLVSPAVRATYAGFWQHLLTRCALPRVPRSPRGPFNREAIDACAARMAEVHRELVAQGPVSARGIAMVNRLLSDGTGPLYNRRVRPAQLDDTLGQVIAALQPGLFGQSFVESAT